MNSSSEAARVLVVDDAASLRNLLCSLLKSEGFNVVGNLDQGNGALALIERTQPNIVCLDYNLPDIDGLDLLGQINAAHPNIAVVMITASNDPNLQSKAAEAGAAGFLHKPFSQQQIMQELQQVDHAQRLMTGASTPHNVEPSLVGKRVLIADDSDALRRLLSMILTESGMDVVAEANNGRQAVELTRQHQPDLICLDVEMPTMGGIDALAEIRIQNPNALVMMITGRSDKQTVQLAGKHGAKGYILKPYQPEKVIAAMKHLFSKPQAG